MSWKTWMFGLLVWSVGILTHSAFEAWRGGVTTPTPTSVLTAGIATALFLVNMPREQSTTRQAVEPSGARRASRT